MKIINPIPPMKPVMNLRLLLLSLNPNSCVKPSAAAGIINIIDIINKVKL